MRIHFFFRQTFFTLTEQRPRVPHYNSDILSIIAMTLQPALLPESASKARDAQKADAVRFLL